MRRCPVWCLLYLALATGPAFAQPAPADEARRAFAEGIAHFEQGSYALALAAFERSMQAQPNPGVLYNTGLSLKALGRMKEAIASFSRYLAEASPSAERRAITEKLRSDATAQLATLTVLAPQNAAVRLDGREQGSAPLAALTLDPGHHLVEVAAPGFVTERREVQLSPAEALSLTVMLEKAELLVEAPPAPTPFLQRTRGRVALGLGALGVVGFAVAGGLGGRMLQLKGVYDGGCAVGPCDHGVYQVTSHYALAADLVLGVAVAALIAALLVAVL
ncbi:MAG: PEGA domain-containing protein [Archangiaceae bacterium]|nr:PEGA domain-containing protein [Archangiaceae bacterium]